MLIDKRNGTVKLNWRTRNYGNHLSIADIARSAGFQAGGHRNAGGGMFEGALVNAREQLVGALRAAISRHGSS
jgi:nanoRNase/pAp phosphatase (c-di-AMP/oligoRNAs hydrolase)